ncbi:TerD family protein [Streptomyces thermocarboxydus]
MLLLAEIYRRGGGWKLRALGQGYADGLAGLARDFGVDVEDDEGAVSTRTAPVVTGRAPVSPAAVVRPPARPSVGSAASGGPPSAGDDFLALVNSARRASGSPPVSHDERLAEAARQHARAMAHGGRLGVEAGRRLRAPARDLRWISVSHRRRAPGVRAAVRGPVRGPLPAARGGPARCATRRSPTPPWPPARAPGTRTGRRCGRVRSPRRAWTARRRRSWS